MSEILKQPCPIEAAEEAEIDRLCHKLHIMPPPKLRLKLEVFSRGGELLKLYEDRARSWVRNAYNFMTMQTMGAMFGTLGTSYGAGFFVMKQTNNSNITNSFLTASSRGSGGTPPALIHFFSGSGITAHGIVVGTSTAAETFEGYALDALIAEGTGAGQMSYAAITFENPSYDAGTKKFTQTIIRYINNNSGGSITVNEAGLYCRLFVAANTSSSVGDFLLARDLLVAGVAVANTAQLKVTYTIESTTYPV